MLGTLIKKEITETILDMRFTIASLLCLVLIPLGTYINVKGYEQRLADYQRRHQDYRRQHEKEVTYDVQAEGFRPPSILSIFVFGLEDSIPDKVTTSRSGVFTVDRTLAFSNSPFLLFGQADLLFSVSIVVSLAALILTFNSISGEKEAGTLKLMLAGRVPRYQVLFSKIVANYVCLIVPFVISLLISLIQSEFSPDISILSREFYPAFLAILSASGLFVLLMVILGVLISSLTRRTLVSMTMCLLVWMVLALVIPKVSPMLARVVYPVEPQTQADKKREELLKDIDDSFQQKCFQAWDKHPNVTRQSLSEYLKKYPGNSQGVDFDVSAGSVAALERELVALDQERRRRIATEVRGLDQDYRNRTGLQNAIAMNLSRTSPISCYTFLVSGLAGTGIEELNNFMANAQRYQDQIQREIYDKFIVRIYKALDTTGWFAVISGTPETVTDMQYRCLSLMEVLQAGGVDLLLLFLFNLLFFSLAFIAFNRYDVR